MDYDVERAFERIENELISSMFRNFKNHRAEETKYGFNWEAWQALQLQALDDYKRKNKKRFKREFTDINKRIDEFIRQARADGAAAQEIEILEAIRRGYKAKASGGAEIAADFIKMNDRKMDALINATVNDMKRAETAMLRMANDKYRKIIFDAQVYSASGAASYEKAVDMAMKDFLRAGINCVEYKNGARHTTRDYVSMVLATTGKRAYLTGEGEMRKRWGESLVIMNKRGNPCPLCAKFVGKVLVDDVWSGGKPDGVHMLMSRAISEGLYHPRCKDGHTTYFEGISDEGVPYTDKERETLAKEYNSEQKRSHAQNQAEKYSRMAAFALDSENKRQYEKRAQEWREISENTVDKSVESGIIELRGDEMAELHKLGRLNTQPLETEFGKLKTDEIIITDERIAHIKERHPEDYDLFEKYGKSAVENPDLIIMDSGNENTVFMVKRLPDTNLNVIVRLILETDEKDYKNSVMTFYRIRDRNLKKLQNKNKTIYKNE